MRVALDADFGQMDNRDITAALIHFLAPFARHFQTRAPSILSRIGDLFFGNEITVIDDDGNPRIIFAAWVSSNPPTNKWRYA